VPAIVPATNAFSGKTAETELIVATSMSRPGATRAAPAIGAASGMTFCRNRRVARKPAAPKAGATLCDANLLAGNCGLV
jgi:hypothetical protein